MTEWQSKSVLLILLSLFMFIHPGDSTAAELPAEGSYTLQRLYRMALEQAEQIGIAQENLAIAENLRVQALSVLKPRLSGVGSYTRYTEEKNMFGSVIQPEWDGAYGLRLGQSFTLNGREITALRVTERGIDQSRADLEDIKERYLLSVAQAFFDVAKSRQTVAIAKANVQRLETHRDAVVSRLKLGDVAVTELYRSEAELADSRAGLIQAENNLQLNQALLGRLVGSEKPLDIVEEPASAQAAVPADLEMLKQTARDNRPDLESLMIQEDIAQLQIKYAKGAYWPRVGVEASWTRILQEPDPVLEESTSIGVSLEVDIYDGGLRRAQISDARRQRHQAELARRDAERGIGVEVEQAWLFWKTQQEVMRSYESQLRYANENYDAVTRLFEHGMANSVDVMDANTLLVTAQRQLSDAHYNIQLAELSMDRAAGTFLPRVESSLRQNRTTIEKP